MIQKNNRPKEVMDSNLIEVEYFNKNDFAIEMIRDDRFFSYVYQNRIPIGPRKTILKPNDWIKLPHRYYIFKSINGPEFFELVVNMGNTKGIGNKHPSPPIIE